MNDEECVYFLQSLHGGAPAQDHIQIRWTDNMTQLTERIDGVDSLRLLATFPGTRLVAQKLHRLFSAKKVHDDWFRPCAGIWAIIKAQALPYLDDCEPFSLAHHLELAHLGFPARLTFPLTPQERPTLIALKADLQKQKRNFKDFVMEAIWEKHGREKGKKK